MTIRVFLLTLITTLYASLQAQAPVKKQPWPVMPNSPNYYEVRQQYLDHIASEIAEDELFGLEPDADDLYAKFYRWDYLLKTRVDAAGNYPDPRTAFLEWEKVQKKYGQAQVGERAANWLPVGTADVPSDGGGAGRVNVIIFDPIDANTMYAGTAGGGLWKTPDLGATWIPLSDNIPVTSIADVVVDPTNNNIIYIATGDCYGYEATWQADDDFWGGVYSAGILKSTDGGATWLPTGLSYLQEDLMIVQRLIIHPDEPNILLAATREGTYRTTDAGATWSLVHDVHCYDFAFHATDPNTIYSVGDRDVYQSSDAGATWSMIKSNLASSDDRMSIETTADDPNTIYVFSSGADMDVSEDGGTTWSALASPAGIVTFYGYYDLVLDVSDLNKDLLFTGGLDMARTTNGGTSWSKKSVWDDYLASNYVHADAKCILTDPNDENIVYAANDGGVFKSTDKGNTWTDISDGLRIAQVYRLSTSATMPGMVLSGWQDNGCNLWDGTSWERVQGGDGMEVIIDHSNEDRMFASFQYGFVNRTVNGGISWFPIAVSGGGWVTPYEMDPVDNLTMYYGPSSGSIQKSTNGGTTWTTYSAGLGGEVFDIAVAPSNTNYVYACALQRIKVSTDGGVNWTNITTGLPTGGIGFNYIAVSDENPEHVWVALSGYDDGNKVYFSDNAGATWTNVSGSLPNVPVNCIVYENVSDDDRLYVGTDIGVFTKSNDTEWEPYMTGLPNVMIHELEINYTEFKLYAATYGRNIWVSDLYEFVVPTLSMSVTDLTYCPGEAIDVNYAATGAYSASNVFTAELSSATGSFATRVVIGTITTDVLTGTIAAVIPADASGNGYRIRVTSSDPALISADNGADITIACDQPTELATEVVTATSANLDWEDITCAISYEVQYKSAIDVDFTYVNTTTSEYTLAGLSPSTPYEWAVRTICLEAPDVSTDFTASEDFTTGQNQVIDLTGMSGFTLYPNPAATETTMQFTLTEGGNVAVSVLDVAGKEVLELQQAVLGAGPHVIGLDVSSLAAGTYMIRIMLNDAMAITPLIVD